jgi:transcriptional regulator with XRE-family HTH domain
MDESLVIKKIKDFRLAKGLSLERLAELTGLTKGYLSRIENSEKAPPLSTLSRISLALEEDITRFFKDDLSSSHKEYAVTRSDERTRTGGRGTPYGYEYEALALDKVGKNMEPYVVTVDYESTTEFQHEGEELIFILEGKIEFFLNGENHVLSKGDSIYFDSGLSHSGRSLGNEKAKMLVVTYSYRRV